MDIRKPGRALWLRRRPRSVSTTMLARVMIMAVVSGIAFAAVRLSTDLQKGIISRFRTMPVTPSSVLSGQVLSSALSKSRPAFWWPWWRLSSVSARDADAAAWLALVRPAGLLHPGH